MTYRPPMNQLRGLSLEKASKYGMPHIGAYYESAAVSSHKRADGAVCAICGQPATNAHHEPPRGSDGLFVLQTKWGAFVLKPALFALCGSGTAGCHNDFHGGARYKARWVWHSDEYAGRWWSGWYLAHGYIPHDSRLYELGHWEIEDKRTGRLLIRDARFIERVKHDV